MTDTLLEVFGRAVLALLVVLTTHMLYVILGRRPRPPGQSCWVWCPFCRVELTAIGEVLSTDPLVVYRCPGCGAVTRWDFDAPVPLLLAREADVELEGEP